MSNSPGNFKTFTEAKTKGMAAPSSSVSVPLRGGMPPYCIYCAESTRQRVTISVSGSNDSKTLKEAKATGCLLLSFGFGGILGLRAGMGPSRSIMNQSSSSNEKITVAICQQCSQTQGTPAATLSKGLVTISCCSDFARKFEAGEGVDPY